MPDDSSRIARKRPAPLRDAGIRLAFVIQRLLVTLPWPAQRALGSMIGRISMSVARRRREIARRNLAICFPELAGQERERLLRRHFRSLGIGIMELGMAWWASDERLRPLGTIHGLDNLQQARRSARAVILVAGHFTSMDLTARLLGLAIDYDGIHRPLGYDVLDRRLGERRGRAARRVYSKFDLRGILSALSAGRTLWMAIDQAQQGTRPVMAAFFGRPAPTTGSPARLAAKTGAAVLPVVGWRTAEGAYEIHIGKALEGFPTGEPEADAARLNAVIEEQVRRVPEQYYWIHRRFKSDAALYADI